MDFVSCVLHVVKSGLPRAACGTTAADTAATIKAERLINEAYILSFCDF